MVREALTTEIPKIMHIEFMRLGLAIAQDGDQLQAQKDFAWVRKMRLASEGAQSVIGSGVVKWVMAIGGLTIAAGVAAIFHLH